jgi:homeobox protein YOX1/YHP1
MAISHASLESDLPSSRVAAQLPYAHVPPAPSPVPYDILAETPPTIKKRKRADARQLEALNRMYARTALPSKEERLQLAKELDMSAKSVRIWLAHIFVYMYNS